MSIATISLRARVDMWLWRHGLALPLAAAALATAVGLLWNARQPPAPAVPSVAPLQFASASAPSSAPKSSPVSAGDDLQHLAAFRQALLPLDQATAAVRQLVVLTQPGLAWQRAEFLQSDDVGPGVVRLQINVPVVGEYGAMRMALQHALLEMPQLSLDQVRLQREQAGESQLEARLHFSLWLSAPVPVTR